MAHNRRTITRPQRIAYLLYGVAVILLVVAGISLIVTPEMRASLPLFELSMISGLVGGGVYALSVERDTSHHRTTKVLITGAAVTAFFAGVTLFTADSPVISQARVFIGYGLWGIGLIFWLMRRFSGVSDGWIKTGVMSCAGLTVLAGGLISLSAWIGSFPAAIVAPICAVVVAAHVHRAVIEPNRWRTLAAYWCSLAAVGYIVAYGLLSPLALLLPDSYAVQQFSAYLFLTAITLGTINQTVAEMQWHNRRITGLLPYWCIAFGWLMSIVLALLLHTAEQYLTTYAQLDAASLNAAVQPLHTGLTVSSVLLAAGFLLYAVGFYVRRIAFKSPDFD